MSHQLTYALTPPAVASGQDVKNTQSLDLHQEKIEDGG